MAIKKSNRGQTIDMDALLAANKGTPAVGNMGVNAAGDTIGPGGVVVENNEQRVRRHYRDTVSSSQDQVSLKGETPKLQPDSDAGAVEPKTAKTAKENKRTKKVQEPSISDTVSEVLADKQRAEQEELPAEPAEFDAPEDLEPIDYKEVELPNGDIEMVPIYKEE